MGHADAPYGGCHVIDLLESEAPLSAAPPPPAETRGGAHGRDRPGSGADEAGRSVVRPTARPQAPGGCSTVAAVTRWGRLIVERVAACGASRRIGEWQVEAVGVSVPGIVHHDDGTVWAPNIDGGSDIRCAMCFAREVGAACQVVVESDRACLDLGRGDSRGGAGLPACDLPGGGHGDRCRDSW